MVLCVSIYIAFVIVSSSTTATTVSVYYQGGVLYLVI